MFVLLIFSHLLLQAHAGLTELVLVSGIGDDNCAEICDRIHLACTDEADELFSETFLKESFHINGYAQHCNDNFVAGSEIEYDSTTSMCKIAQLNCNSAISLANVMRTCLCSGLEQQAYARPSQEWIQINGEQYCTDRNANQSTFSQSQLHCNSKLAFPIAIKNLSDHRHVLTFLKDMFGDDSKIWLNWQEGKWMDTNKPDQFNNWAPDEPKLTDQCAYMDTSDGLWYTQDCNSQAHGVCQLSAFHWWKPNWGYFTWHEGRFMNGTSVEVVHANSISHCARLCRTNIQCLGANFNKISDSCSLFSQLGSKHPEAMNNDHEFHYLERHIHTEFYDKANPMLHNFCVQHGPCENGATCIDNNNRKSYKCICTFGWKGVNCHEADFCAQLSPCLNGATCIDRTDLKSYQCVCTETWKGFHCEEPVNVIWLFGGPGADAAGTAEPFYPNNPSHPIQLVTLSLPTFCSVGGSVNGKALVTGGEKGGFYSDIYLKSGTIFDPDTREAVSLPDMSIKRKLAGAAVIDNILYVCGGRTGRSLATVKRSCEKYENGKWTSFAPMKTARHHYGFTAAMGKLYAVCGVGINGALLSTAEKYDPETDLWAWISSVPGGVRPRATAGAVDGYVYACGGFGTASGSVRRDCYRYTENTNAWERVANMNYPRVDHRLIAFDGKLMALGGANVHVEVYDAKLNKWTNGNKTFVHPRSRSVAVAFEVEP